MQRSTWWCFLLEMFTILKPNPVPNWNSSPCWRISGLRIGRIFIAWKRRITGVSNCMVYIKAPGGSHGSMYKRIGRWHRGQERKLAHKRTHASPQLHERQNRESKETNERFSRFSELSRPSRANKFINPSWRGPSRADFRPGLEMQLSRACWN